MESLSDATVRKHFRISAGPNGGYWMLCNDCDKVSKGWDYRANALTVGFAHQYNRHKMVSSRSAWAAGTTFGKQE